MLHLKCCQRFSLPFFFLSPRFRRKSQDNRLPKAIFSLFYSDEREFRAPMNRFVAGIKSPFPT